MSSLKPCAHCGSTDIDDEDCSTMETNGTRIVCNGCGMMVEGYGGSTCTARATAKWNTRVIDVSVMPPNPRGQPAATEPENPTGVARSAAPGLLGGSVGGDSASGAAVDHGSTAIRSGGDQPASPLARLASPGKSGSNLTAATGTFATSRAVLADADHSAALPGATGEPNPKADVAPASGAHVQRVVGREGQ